MRPTAASGRKLHRRGVPRRRDSGSIGESALERRAQPDRQRAGEDRRVAEARDLDPGRERQRAASRSRIGVRSRSPLAPMPPPSTISSTSATAAIGAMCSAIRRAASSTTARAQRIAAPRGAEDRRAREGRLAARSAASAWPARRHRPRSRPRTGRPGSRRPGRARSRARPRAPWWPRSSSPRITRPAPRPVPTRRKAKLSTPWPTPRQRSPTAARLMSFSTETAMPRRASSSRPTSSPSRPGMFSASRTAPLRGSTAPGTPITAPSIGVRGQLGGGDQLRLCSSTAASSSVERVARPRSRCPGGRGCRRAGRRSRRAGSARPCRARARARPPAPTRTASRRSAPRCVAVDLAHQPGLEQRAQRERHGGLGDPDPARDLGAGDRGVGADRLEHGALVERAQHRRACAEDARGRAPRHPPRRSPVSGSNTCASPARGRSSHLLARAPAAGASRCARSASSRRRPSSRDAERVGVGAELLDHLDRGRDPLPIRCRPDLERLRPQPERPPRAGLARRRPRRVSRAASTLTPPSSARPSPFSRRRAQVHRAASR